MTEAILHLKDVQLRHSEDFTLGPCTLSVQPSDVAGFIGGNGAGKSTLFSLVTGSADPTGGEIEFLGQRLKPDKYNLKKSIGYLPQHLALPKWVSGREILRYAAGLYQIEDPKNVVAHQLEYWDCQDFQNRPLAACSHGMQKRVALAVATMHDPQLLVLDEPFSGLDLFHIRALTELIKRRQRENKTTILSTHIAPYSAQLCTCAWIVAEGKIDSVGTWPSLDEQGRVSHLEETFFPAGEADG